MPKITDQELKAYFDAGNADPQLMYVQSMYQGQGVIAPLALQGANLHPLYSETILQYYPLRIHADGIYPAGMIESRRPSETVDILMYRRQVYKPITKLPIGKVITALGKIRRSPDWTILFEKDAIPAKILDEETLEYYTTNNVPGFKSLTNWAFNILLRQQCIDPNAVVAVLPTEAITLDKFTTPVPLLFNCDHVMEYNELHQIAILKSRKRITFANKDGSINYNGGNRFYYIDDKEFVIYDQTFDGYEETFQQSHNLGKMPAFKVSGDVFKQYDDATVNKSRLDTMVPFLDEAACEYSDLKGSKIQHLFPLMWYYQKRDCVACNGLGVVAPGKTECGKCGGTGKIKFSPFAQIQVDPPTIGQQSIPAPPAGYISRDTNILDLQDKSVEKNNYKALAAINMQFLDQTPLSISGDAKNVDREELNNFVYNVAEDLIATMDKVYYFTNEWRYSFYVPDKKAREAMLPQIPVPQNFDLLPSNFLMQEITTARSNKVNPFLLATLEKELAAKKFYNDPDLAEIITLYFELDPLPGYAVDEKLSLISAQGITQEDFIISSYIAQFVHRAIQEDPDFQHKAYDEQMKVLTGYAQEKKAITDKAAQLIQKQKLAVAMKNINGPGDQGGGQGGNQNGNAGQNNGKQGSGAAA